MSVCVCVRVCVCACVIYNSCEARMNIDTGQVIHNTPFQKVTFRSRRKIPFIGSCYTYNNISWLQT